MANKAQKRLLKTLRTRHKSKRASKVRRKTTHTRRRTEQRATNTRVRREQKRPHRSSGGATTVQGAANQQAQGLMQAPASGVKVRMYRQGHGDCFLLAFPRPTGRPAYVLIDCGFKPGSNSPFGLADISTIVANIHGSTGGHLDLDQRF